MEVLPYARLTFMLVDVRTIYYFCQVSSERRSRWKTTKRAAETMAA